MRNVYRGRSKWGQKVAYAHFQMRCKDAGIRTTQREEGVEGVYLMKLRPRYVNYDDQFTPDDVYGFDVGGMDYIKTFLRITKGADIRNQFGEPPKHPKGGYRWVEAHEANDRQLYRYTLGHKVVQTLSDDQWEAAKRNNLNIAAKCTTWLLSENPFLSCCRYGVNWSDIHPRRSRHGWRGVVHRD